MQLTELDHRIIAALREDGRAPVSKLASILKVSRATIQSRLDKLVESGSILGFTIRSSEYHENEVRAVMMIEVIGKSTTEVIKRLRGLPELRSLHTTNGTWDLVAEINAQSLADFDRVLREVRSTEGILNSETSILLSSV